MVVNASISLLVLAVTGVIAVAASRLLRIPRPLALLASGLLLQILQSQQVFALTLPNAVILPFIVIGVVFAAVDHAVQVNFREWTEFMHEVAQFTLVRIGLIIAFFVLAAVIFKLAPTAGLSAGVGVLGALVLLSGAPELFKHEIRSHAVRVLVHTDALVSSLVGMAAPVLFVTARTIESGSDAAGWLLGACAAAGTGLFLGILFYRLLRVAQEEWARVGLFIVAVLSYVLADGFFPGGGVLACLSLGLLLANVHLPHRLVHGPAISSVAEGAVFLLLGVLIPITAGAFLISVIFVGLIIFSRFFALELSLSGHFTLREKLLLSLNNPVGLPAAAIVLALAVTAPYVGLLKFVPGVLLLTLALHSLVHS